MEVLAAQCDGRAQNQEIRPGDGDEGLVVHAADPRNAAPVIEADDEVDIERDAAALPDNQPNKVRRMVARRHKINERCRAVRRLEPRLENQRAVAIASARPRLRILGRNAPASVLRRAEQGSETRR
jgi:hypothetical protein